MEAKAGPVHDGKPHSRHTHLAVFPPVLVLEFGGAALKLRGSSLQGVGPVIQLGQLLVSLQDFVHVHAHDVHHLLDKRISQRSSSDFHFFVTDSSGEVWYDELSNNYSSTENSLL